MLCRFSSRRLPLTACGPKAPDTAELSDLPSGGVRRAGANGCADAGADGGAHSGADRRAALHRGGGDHVWACEGRSDGAKALSRWPVPQGRTQRVTFIPDGLDTPMYTVPARAQFRRDPRGHG